MTQHRQIPVVSHDAFARMAADNPNLLHETPWIVEGYIERWPGYAEWQDLAYLRRRFGHLQAFAKAPNFVTNRHDRLVSVATRYDQYIDYIEHPERVRDIYDGYWMDGSYEAFVDLGLPLYCGTLKIVRQADDPVFADVDPILPAPLRAWNHALPYYYSLFNHFWLLVSLPGALTPLHIDNNGTIAIIAQLKGRKRATLYAPADLPFVRSTAVGFMDPANPDPRDFPMWDRAVQWTGDIEPGQVLFVGTEWAHHVTTLETSISVSFDFVDRSNLAAYARSSNWASALGNRVKRNADLFVQKTGGRLSHALVRDAPSATVGRLLMSHVLRPLCDGDDDTETGHVRRLYAAHLAQLPDIAHHDRHPAPAS